MTNTRFLLGRATAILGLALLAAVLAACAPQPAPQDEVAGEMATPQATPVLATGVDGQGAAASTPTAEIPGLAAGDPANAFQRVQSFEGELRITVHPGQPDSASVTMAHWFMKPDLTRLEVLDTDGFDLPIGSTIVSDGAGLSIYDPAANQVTRLDMPLLIATYLALPSEGALPAQHVLSLQQLLAGLARQATFTIDQTESVAGRAATMVTATLESEETAVRIVRLWLDRATGVPLRLETVGAEDRVLMSAEYLRFDPAAEVADERFSFEPPAGAQVRTVTPEDLARMADFQTVTLDEARQRTGFDLLLPEVLPMDIQERETWIGTFHDRAAVVTFYGTAEETSTALVQTPAEASIVAPRGTERIEEADFVANVYDKGDVVVVEWVEEDTHLTLISTLHMDQVVEMARSAE
jgi:outer membrane lipoprotein-sorting protein